MPLRTRLLCHVIKNRPRSGTLTCPRHISQGIFRSCTSAISQALAASRSAFSRVHAIPLSAFSTRCLTRVEKNSHIVQNPCCFPPFRRVCIDCTLGWSSLCSADFLPVEPFTASCAVFFDWLTVLTPYKTACGALTGPSAIESFFFLFNGQKIAATHLILLLPLWAGNQI